MDLYLAMPLTPMVLGCWPLPSRNPRARLWATPGGNGLPLICPVPGPCGEVLTGGVKGEGVVPHEVTLGEV